MNDTKSLRLIIGLIVAALALVLIVISVTRVAHDQVYSAQLNLKIAPTGAKIVVNGASTGPGIVGVKPGTVAITVSRSGFASQTKTLKVAKGQKLTIAMALTSNSPSTKDWYSNNSNDEATLEQVTGQQYNQQSTQSVQQVPLIQQLPYIDPGLTYRIDYGEPLAGTNVPGIYITAPTTQGQQAALQWIKDQGYDPSTLHIQYNTASVNP